MPLVFSFFGWRCKIFCILYFNFLNDDRNKWIDFIFRSLVQPDEEISYMGTYFLLLFQILALPLALINDACDLLPNIYYLRKSRRQRKFLKLVTPEKLR